jgi:hypothetical protein
MPKKLLIIAVLICFCAPVCFSQRKRAKRENRNDRLITALIDAEEVRGIFADDAMYLYTGTREIQKIFALGKKAIPLLIAHLDDKRLTGVRASSATFEKTEEFQVTIGAACFDLLNYIIAEDARFFDQDCLKDLRERGEGHTSSCANAKYAVFPEDFWAGEIKVRGNLWEGKTLVVKKKVVQAKRRWQRAYRNRQIRYVKFDS